MTKKIINIGSSANAGNGDPLRLAFGKINDNFNELYTLTGGSIGALTELAQDYAAPLFTHGSHSGITFTYDDVNNRIVATVATDYVTSITDFGEGFALNGAGKIVTNKLYSTNETQPTQHYRLTLDTNGVIHLPDQSIINGATLKSVAGNYAGITAGTVGADEDSWMWVDANGAWVATDYSETAYTWHFKNDGKLEFPDGSTQETAYQYTASDTAPALTAGSLWFNTDEGKLYVNHNNIWVDANPTEIDADAARFNNLGQIELPVGGDIVDSNGTSVLGGNTNTGNIGFVDDAIYNINGIILENADLTHGATAALILPGNGSSTDVLQLTNTYGNVAITTGTDNAHIRTWIFNSAGTLNTPSVLPKTFTANCDGAHLITQSARAFDPTGLWYFEVTFAVNPDGTVETQISNNTPWPSNPGYLNNDQFEFTEADHGITGYLFTLTLVDIQTPGPSMVTTNLTASIPPEYPSTINTNGNAKLTANGNSWIFGSNGSTTMPSGSLNLTNGDDRVGTGGWSQIALSYSGTTGYPHFIRTRHDDSVTSNNAIDFWISDGTVNSAGAVRTLSVQKNGVVVGNIEIQGGLKDVEGSTGTTGQVLTRVVNGGVKWADATSGAISSSGGKFSTSFDTNANAGIFNMAGTATIQAIYGINLETGYSSPVTIDTGNSQWTFAESDGILTVPGVIKPVSTAANVDLGTGSAQFRDINVIGSVGPVNSLTIYGGSQITHTGAGDHDVVLSANGTNYTFGAGGTLNIPGAISARNTSQVGSTLSIATNSDGGNVGYISGGTATAMSVAYDADIISTYAVGSTITFQDNTVATITQIDDYGPTSIDIFYLPEKSGTLFPITLKTSDYAAGSSANATIVVGSNGTPGINTWTFGTDGVLTLPGTVVSTGHLNLDADYDGGDSVYIGGNHPTAGMLGGVAIGDTRGGFVEILTTKFIVGETAVPAHSYGVDGDIKGQVAFDGDFIYYCKQNYVDNVTDIWVRSAWTSTNW